MSQSSASGGGPTKYSKPSVGRPTLKLEPAFVDNFKSEEKAAGEPWWRFTLDTGAAKVWAHPSAQEQLDLESRTGQIGPDSEFTKRAQALSSHHAHTPGWEDPWTPFRLHTANPFDADGPFAANGPDDPRLSERDKLTKRTLWQNFTNFLLFSPFAPFWLRFVNLIFTSATLALAGRIMAVEIKAGIRGIVGTSTITALIFAPLTLLHIFAALWLEYFGAPIGVWSVGKKMFHTLSELIFIALWSAELSLAFDDLFSSAAACTRWTPYERFRGSPGTVMEDVPRSLCQLQSSLVAMVFVSLILYQWVLIISLFRIFQKVSRPRR